MCARLTHPSAQPPATPCAGLAASHAAQCGALVELAAATVLSRWTRSEGWLSGADLEPGAAAALSQPSDPVHCTWLGVSCDAGGDITALELDMNQLAGLMPASLGHLSALRTL